MDTIQNQSEHPLPNDTAPAGQQPLLLALPESKPRPDARLKTLDPELQDQIVSYSHDHSLAATVDWLAQRNIRTSSSALSRFLQWHRLQQQLANNRSVVEAFLAERQDDPSLSREQLVQLGYRFFCLLAIAESDHRIWHAAQAIHLRQSEFDLRQKELELQDRIFRAAEEERNKPVRPLTRETLELIERELNFFPPRSPGLPSQSDL